MAEEPALKKSKMYDINHFILEVKTLSKNLKAVLSDEFDSPVELVQVYAGHVKDKTILSTLIQLLNERMPLKELQHLKRVFNNSVLLCFVSYLDKDQNIQDYVRQHIPELDEYAFDYIREISVPFHPPKTKKQSSEFCKKWPCNFHPNKYLEKLISNNFFSVKELQQHRSIMSTVFEIAKLHLEAQNWDTSEENLLKINIGIVFDPILRSVVAIGIDDRDNHPVKHATMVAIDNVAKTQNGGAWDGDIGTSQIISTLKRTLPHITFGHRQYLNKKEMTEREQLNCPYLCTGYYIYLLREPCAMCAMGLVHARIKRVFFCYANNEKGVLMSREKLHCVPSLNHHFEVFTGFL